MQLFEIVGDNFFKVLSGKYKQQMLDCLELIYEIYRTETVSYGVEKEIVVGKLTDYFSENSDSDLYFDEETNNGDIVTESAHTAREKALLFIRKLRNAGWIQDEQLPNGSVRVNMPRHSVNMLKTMIAVSEKKEIEYQGHLATIYTLFKNLDSTEMNARPYSQIIIPAFNATTDLFSSLKSLSTDIKMYIQEMEKNDSLQDVVEHLISYHDKIGSKSYQRMHDNDNVLRFRSFIYKSLGKFHSDDELMEKSVRECLYNHDFDDEQSAKADVLNKINQMMELFESYDDIALEIQKKHNRYLSSAVNKAKLATMSSANLEGKLSAVLRRLATEDLPEEQKEEIIGNILSVNSHSIVTHDSLYTPQKTRSKEEISSLAPIHKAELSEEDKAENRRKLMESYARARTIENLNFFADSALKDKQEILASDVASLKNEDDVIKLFCLMFNRDNENRSFNIENKYNYIIRGDWKFRDFSIKKRR